MAGLALTPNCPLHLPAPFTLCWLPLCNSLTIVIRLAMLLRSVLAHPAAVKSRAFDWTWHCDCVASTWVASAAYCSGVDAILVAGHATAGTAGGSGVARNAAAEGAGRLRHLGLRRCVIDQETSAPQQCKAGVHTVQNCSGDCGAGAQERQRLAARPWGGSWDLIIGRVVDSQQRKFR